MSMQGKATPGPWFAKCHPDSPTDTITVFSTLHPICRVAMGWKETRGTDEANARVIAAAPAMLAVCERIVELANGLPATDLPTELVEMARAALPQ